MPLTKAQLKAVNAVAPKVLVSAAAGSGKSTVLTERLIRSITRPVSPYDISKIIAVTFTRASAADLKKKIGEALTRASVTDPDNKRTTDQLIKLPAASISTIDSMCSSLIKNHFSSLGISPGMKVAETSEIDNLKLSVMTEVIELAYAGSIEGIPDFSLITTAISGESERTLAEDLTNLYDTLRSQPDYESNWEKALGELSGDFSNTGFCRMLCETLKIRLDHLKKGFDFYLEKLKDYKPFIDKYYDSFKYDADFINLLTGAADRNDISAVSSLLSAYSPKTLGKMPKGDQTTDTSAAQELRSAFKSEEKKLAQEFSFTEEEIKSTSGDTLSISGQILTFIKFFHAEYSAEKQKRSILDYADLEDYTLKLLYSDVKNRVISETAKNISSSLDEIFVDEYQDISPVQDMIFTALSVNTRIFMVGDIKQSIYNFRGASPEIFANYRRCFTQIPVSPDDNEPAVPSDDHPAYYDENVTVFLSSNFRSDKKITDFVNKVAESTFGCTPENDPVYSYRIPYDRVSDSLVPKAVNTAITAGVSFLICPSLPKDYDYPTESDTSSTAFIEAEAVANKIYDLISNENADPEEIAIILRTANKPAEVYEDALIRRGIPVATENGKKLFDCPEIKLAVCILNCIDNPYEDIFLTGALRSPVFFFTLNDLIKIRFYSKDAHLYDALEKYAKETSDPKAVRFLSFLERMREYAGKNSVDRLVWQVYTETSLFSVIYENGNVLPSTAARRRANLILLHSLAKSFSSVYGPGLYPFMERIRLLIDNPGSAPASPITTGGVHIMSMHKAKGLEYDYVFLSGLSGLISYHDDCSAETVSSRTHGVMMKFRDPLGVTKNDSPSRIALAYHNDVLKYDEEIRILYVALTRAKSRLYLVGKENKFDEVKNNAVTLSNFITPGFFGNQKKFITWILSAVYAEGPDRLPKPDFNIETPGLDEIAADTVRITSGPKTQEPVQLSDTDREKLYGSLKEKLTVKYKFIKSVTLPAKLSVSKLYPDILDENDYDIPAEVFVPEEKPDNSSKLRPPVFLSGEKKTTGADRGTATHVFMQFCSFENVEKNGIKAETDRLVEKSFILKDHGALIDVQGVSRFFKSEVYRKMKESDQVTREYRFNIKFPASDFTRDKERKEEYENEFVFVQGVIDCYFTLSDGSICLLDYKTDRVPDGIYGNKEKEDAFFNERHGNQLKYYKTALTKLTGKNVSEVLIYSFHLGRTVKIAT